MFLPTLLHYLFGREYILAATTSGVLRPRVLPIRYWPDNSKYVDIYGDYYDLDEELLLLSNKLNPRDKLAFKWFLKNPEDD